MVSIVNFVLEVTFYLQGFKFETGAHVSLAIWPHLSFLYLIDFRCLLPAHPIRND